MAGLDPQTLSLEAQAFFLSLDCFPLCRIRELSRKAPKVFGKSDSGGLAHFARGALTQNQEESPGLLTECVDEEEQKKPFGFQQVNEVHEAFGS